MTKLKTFIRWPGNKSKHLRHILPYIPDDYNTYIEPFVGSGALFLNLQPDKWIINDLNKDLIEAWKYVKEEPEKIIEFFKLFGKIFKPMNRELKILFCRELTNDLNNMKYDFLKTVIYLVMKYCSYLGLVFFDNKFYFPSLDLNIEKNRYPFLNKQYIDNLFNISLFLKTGKIYNKDYKYILSKAKENDFVFLDPPYIEEHDYNFQYNIDEKLDNKFIKELYTEVKKLDKKGIRWIMTQANTKEVRKIFKEYKIKKFKVYRMGKKAYVNELIIMNY
jgi:DNA adenine methylase